RRAMLVIFSELSESAVEESLLPAIAMVAKHHVVVVASVTDPVVSLWETAKPASTEATYRKAAAHWSLEKRRRTAASLRALGVTVIDALPDELPTLLAETYVRAKAVGRI
ncbi:MAG TPA: hypothetical protein VMU77_06515, partial [Acidimicrobiales bacterium]|nr:hypothetical protein [Acidimicrobiales bacterium]